jgi:hypothetical protein
MERDEKMKEAQEILNWGIVHLDLNIHCKVIDYKYESFKVQFFPRRTN